MPLAVASRFSVLRIDDDVDDGPKKSKKIVDGKKVEPKKKSKSDTGVGKTNNSNQNTGTKAKGKVGSLAPQKKKAPTAEQWSDWQKKDAEVADGNFEVDLHQAILLSKVDYEKNKIAYEQRKLAAQEEKKVPIKKTKKSSKPQPMSLDQFNNLNSSSSEPAVIPQVNGSTLELEDNGTFFERIKDEAKEALHLESQRLARKSAPSRVPDIDKAITQAQYEVNLEEKDQQISTLNDEVTKLKAELHMVKTRNKKLCHILANGEMKDKAELLVELDRMHQVKNELSSEVDTLHTQLEQERSKNHALTLDPKNKAQSKKRGASESTQ